MGFLTFITSKMGIALLCIMGIAATIWGALTTAKNWMDDHDESIRQSTITEVKSDLQEQLAAETNETLQQLQENSRIQADEIARLANNETRRTRQLDRISAAVQETIIEQGGEQLASPALRQSAQLLAEEWDRLYADKVEIDNEPTP